MEYISCCVWQSLSVLEQFFGSLRSVFFLRWLCKTPSAVWGSMGMGENQWPDEFCSQLLKGRSCQVLMKGLCKKKQVGGITRYFPGVVYTNLPVLLSSQFHLHTHIYTYIYIYIYHIVMYTIIVHAIYWFSWCYVHYWYTHTQRCKYLHVYTFLPIRFLPEAIKRSNSLPIWAAEIDKCHAVVASCEAEVCHIQAEGKPGFQGQGAWDRLGWAWKKIGSSQSQISQTDMTNNSPGGLGVQTFWKSRFRVPMWRRVPLADAVGLRKKRSGQEDYGVVLATLATWRYSERKCKSLRCDLRCDFPQVFTHVSFHQPPNQRPRPHMKEHGGQSVNLTSKPGFETPLQHTRVWSSVWINTALAMRLRLGQ